MKTIIDKYTGKVLFATGEEINLQENQIQIDNLLTENFIKPYWDFQTLSFYEQATQNEIYDSRIAQAIEIDLYYTSLISDILEKHIQKKVREGIDIPQVVNEEVDRLKLECNQKISDLGISDYSYRQQNIKLYKEV